MNPNQPSGSLPAGEKRLNPASTVTVCVQGLRQLVGLAFLVWSLLAGGALLRWLLFGERSGFVYDLLQFVLGGLVAALLWFIWQRVAVDDREHIVKTLARWALAVAIALIIKIYWPEH